MYHMHHPHDPSCPVLGAKLDALHEDPMTAASGVGDEIADDIIRKHVRDCDRCRDYGASNVEVTGP